MNTLPVIDTHMHLWDLDRGGYDWLGPQHGSLFRSFGPEQAEPECAAAGIAEVILVQAQDSTAESDYLLDCARRWERVRGVIGWVELDSPERAREHLDSRAQEPMFLGVRHLVHDDPRADFLALPGVRSSLRDLAARGLIFEVPDAWPVHLGATRDLARAIPELRIVVDHLAKPPRETAARAAWERQLRAVAAEPGTVAKISGLHSWGHAPEPQFLREVVEIALEAFGPERLMYGGDWPMTVPGGGYSAAWEVYAAIIGELSPAERAAILGGTAQRVYPARAR